MTETVLSQVFKLRRNKGKVPCPVPECHDFINSLIAYDLLLERERSRYLSIINQDKKIESSGIFDVESNVLRVRSAILDVMTLRCPNPNCRVAVDPTPDACAVGTTAICVSKALEFQNLAI